MDRGVIVGGGGTIALTRTEARLLRYLHRHRGRAVGRDELLQQVWGYRPGVRTTTVESTIQRLRAKIERDPSVPDHLRTVRGEGYRFDDAAEPRVDAHQDATLLEPIFGREAEIETIHAWIRDGARLVTVTGPPGAGKTWLARALLGSRPGGFADLTGLRTLADLRSAVSPPTHGLWVLDDVQRLDPPAAREITGWLRRATGLSLVATAHERLGLEGEQTLPLDLLSVDAAVQLLQHRLRALGLPEPDPTVLHRVASQMERLPLALDVVAGSLEDAPVAIDLGQLLDAPPVRRDARTLREAVAGAVARLDPDRARSLSELALFRGTFAAAAALAVLSDGSGLAALRRRSLIRRLPDGRFTLYDAVRTAAPPPPTAAARRLAAWFDAQSRERSAPAHLAAHRSDLVALIARDDLSDRQILPMIETLGALTIRYGATREWEALQAAVRRASPGLRASLCWLVAVEHRANGRHEPSDRYAAEGVEADPDDALAARLLVMRAQAATNLDDLESAAHYARLAGARPRRPKIPGRRPRRCRPSAWPERGSIRSRRSRSSRGRSRSCGTSVPNGTRRPCWERPPTPSSRRAATPTPSPRWIARSCCSGTRATIAARGRCGASATRRWRCSTGPSICPTRSRPGPRSPPPSSTRWSWSR